MATYSPQQLGIKAPAGGFQQGGWYNGRQFWGGSLSEAGQIHPSSNQQGAGQAVSQEVRNQSAAQQGVSSQQFNNYINQQNQQAPKPAPAPSPAAAPSAPSMPGGAGVPSGINITNPQVPNLPEIYQRLFKESGVDAIQGELSTKEKQFNEAKMGINDNPFLSEATRVGRLEKLQMKYNDDTASLRNDVATKKADIEMQLNLQTKQFDINSQAAQQALNQFQVLLDSGALNNASGEDIASLTYSTGLSSTMISSAIQSNKVKGYQSSVQTFDDGVNEGYQVLTIDAFGNIVNSQQQITGKSSKAVDSSSQNVFNGLGKQSGGGSVWEIVGNAGKAAQGISSLWGN